MALSKLSGDEQGIILGQLRNTLEPRLVMYFSSASTELRALLTPAVQRELRDDYEEATALCLKVGIRDCRELREATEVTCDPQTSEKPEPFLRTTELLNLKLNCVI